MGGRTPDLRDLRSGRSGTSGMAHRFAGLAWLVDRGRRPGVPFCSRITPGLTQRIRARVRGNCGSPGLLRTEAQQLVPQSDRAPGVGAFARRPIPDRPLEGITRVGAPIPTRLPHQPRATATSLASEKGVADRHLHQAIAWRPDRARHSTGTNSLLPAGSIAARRGHQASRPALIPYPGYTPPFTARWPTARSAPLATQSVSSAWPTQLS